ERAQARQELRGMRDDRPAIRAELQADPAPRFVGAMLVRLEVLGALDARVALVEPGRHDKRAPRAALAELAMTGDRADRLAGCRVADGTAEAAAGVDVIIHLASSSGPGSYLLLVLRPSSVFSAPWDFSAAHQDAELLKPVAARWFPAAPHKVA